MLTPQDITSTTLKSGMGYKKKEVEAFLLEIQNSYLELYKENEELKEKASVLSEGVQYYKNLEKTLQKSLVLAEKTSNEIIATAETKAQAIEQDAKIKANMIISDSQKEVNQLHNQIIYLIQQYEKYKTQCKQFAATQLELLESSSYELKIPNLDELVAPITTNSFNMDYKNSQNMVNQSTRDMNHNDSQEMVNQSTRDANHNDSQNMVNQNTRDTNYNASQNMVNQSTRDTNHDDSHNVMSQNAMNTDYNNSQHIDNQNVKNTEQDHSQTIVNQDEKTVSYDHSQTIDNQSTWNTEQNTPQTVVNQDEKTMDDTHLQIIDSQSTWNTEQDHSQTMVNQNAKTVEYDNSQAINNQNTWNTGYDNSQTMVNQNLLNKNNEHSLNITTEKERKKATFDFREDVISAIDFLKKNEMHKKDSDERKIPSTSGMSMPTPVVDTKEEIHTNIENTDAGGPIQYDTMPLPEVKEIFMNAHNKQEDTLSNMEQQQQTEENNLSVEEGKESVKQEDFNEIHMNSDDVLVEKGIEINDVLSKLKKSFNK